MTAYDKVFLKHHGYFSKEGTDTAHINGRDIDFYFDLSSRLAYFEGVDSDRQQSIVSELRSVGRNFDFYWFWNPDNERVAVYNRYGEHKWFIYNQSIGLAADARRSKKSQLESIDGGVETLFDIRAVVDKFYRNLWDIRLDIARSFEVPGDNEISDSERLMAAQRTIDRLIFCYFLSKKDIIHGIDNGRNRFGLAPEEMFETVINKGEFYSFLADTFFNHLNSDGWTEHQITEEVAITYPYLSGGLFRDHKITIENGDQIHENELDATTYDWTVLVEELNRYNWLIEESPSEAAEHAGADKLSPAVLGHIFEKFVITISELSDEDELSLEELEEMNVSASGEQMLEGNRQVGAYYTPNYIAYENTRETLWNRVLTELSNVYGLDREDAPSPDVFFESINDDEYSLPLTLDDVEQVLRDITILDPAAGSGAFLMTAGEILETWRSRCSDEDSQYEIRREIIRKSLYGVDLLDGAVEVCKLRLWLWLTGATTIDLDEDVPSVETLPNIDFNIRQGNSLIGVAEPEYDSLIAHIEFDWTDDTKKNYPEAVTDYREHILKYQVASGNDVEDLRDTITNQREILQDEFNDTLAQDSSVTVEEEIGSYREFTRVMADITGKVKFNLDFDSAMTDAERQKLSDAGFREQKSWETTAYHSDIRKASAEKIKDIFEMMEDRGTISVERPIRPSDIEELDPFHWIFEFPTAYAPTGENNKAFDIVIGNPPHGSSVSTLRKSLLEERYSLVEGSREVAKMFTERSWTLTNTELSYIVPKASTYNSNWEDFREYCLPKMYRGIDLGKAFRNVDHEQVTIHLSRVPNGGSYRCGPLPEGAYHLDDSAEIDESFAERFGTLPVSFSSRQQQVAKGLADVDFPTLGEEGADAGRGASTTNRISDPEAPIGYNGKQVQRYFTRAATDHVDVDGLSNASAERLESPKVMAQNIIAHVQNPYDHLVIAAVYDPVQSYNFETVTNILLPEDSKLSLPVLTALLNTQFVNWFVYFSIFNRAVRDMHLDRYFLERVVLPKSISDVQHEIVEKLYGLLAVTHVAEEYDALPGAQSTYEELQSVTNALAYEMYLRDAEEPPLETQLAETVHEILGEFDIEYEEWYAAHLQSSDSAEVKAKVNENETLFDTAESVADALRCEETTKELEAIADHPWVEVIERGQHYPEKAERPQFGPIDNK